MAVHSPLLEEPDAGRRRPADRQVLLSLSLPGEPGNERTAMARVAEAVAPLGLEPARLERLKTAVSEAAMNAIEYGSRNDPAIPVEIVVGSPTATSSSASPIEPCAGRSRTRSSRTSRPSWPASRSRGAGASS